LRGANLHGARVRKATLIGTDLRGANLAEADFQYSHLREANLDEADLREADLQGADLRDASMAGADLADAVLGYTVFGRVDLSRTKGLAETVHHGPSTIGVDTIERSRGNIPDIFLRRAGVPEPFITNMKALIGAMSPIQFYSCFISYSTKDQKFADRLYADLQMSGVRCWFAPHDLKGGKKLHDQIDEAIRIHERLLLILSPASMASEWVKTEIAKARKRELKEKQRVLFPLALVEFEFLHDWECFDADTGKDSAREIREYFIPDFSRWKEHDSYRQAFERLLRDLKAESRA
jgi:uncharacterized protein YjbI with pentapeptide repeats